MEVGQQAVDMPDSRGWMNEDVCRAALPDQLAVTTSCGLEHTNGGRPDRKDPPGVIDCGCGRIGNGELLFAHAVIGDFLALDRLERSGADMKRNERMRQLRQNCRSEMQAS